MLSTSFNDLLYELKIIMHSFSSFTTSDIPTDLFLSLMRLLCIREFCYIKLVKRFTLFIQYFIMDSLVLLLENFRQIYLLRWFQTCQVGGQLYCDNSPYKVSEYFLHKHIFLWNGSAIPNYHTFFYGKPPLVLEK